MRKETQTVKKSQPDKKNGHKLQPASIPEQVKEFSGHQTTNKHSGHSEPTLGLVGTNYDGPIMVQAGRLSETRMQTAQQRALASQIGEVYGNLHLQRVMAANKSSEDGETTPYHSNDGNGRAIVQRKVEGAALDGADQKAIDVYEALDGWNNEEKALGALQGQDHGMRQNLQSRFSQRYDKPLKTYLKEQLSGDWLVKSYALLTAPNYFEPQVGLAQALIPLGTRDEELFRILDSLPRAGRQLTEKKYDETFPEIGKGSLKADLKDDLTGWRLEKSLAMLNRDLTSADILYFDSVGINGTHDDSVVARLQSEWAQGPTNFASFDKQWHDYVMNEAHWSTDPAWTSKPLYTSMYEELSGETWELAKAVLDAYKGAKGQGLTTGGQLTEEQQFASEEIQLTEANGRLAAATTGGYTGIGTNEQQVFDAIATIHKTWQGRINRTEAKSDKTLRDQYQKLWDAERARLIALIPSEMNESSADFKRIRILLEGSLTPADEVWLASKDLDYDKVLLLITKYWAMGQMGTLLAQADKARTINEGGKEVELRPSYTMALAIPTNEGQTWYRMAKLVYPGKTDAVRGAERLKLELDEGTSESDLQKAYDFLNTDGVSPGLRNSVIETYANQYLGGGTSDKPVKKFLDHIQLNYGENKNSYWKVVNLLDPTRDPKEMLRRAQGQQKANDSTVGGLIAGSYDVATGEGTQAVTNESLQRLEYISKLGANDPELQAIMALTGAASKEALAELEYKNFQSRLEEVRSIKRAIVEALAQAAEFAIDLAITVATGGAGAAVLIASLASAVAGMLIREALLGEDYDLLSAANAKQLALVVASHGFGSANKGFAGSVLDAEKLKKLGTVGVFMKEAAIDAATQIQVSIASAALNDKIPKVEDIGAGVISILGSAVASGTGASIKLQISQNAGAIEKLRANVIADVSKNLISGSADEASNLVKTGVGDLTGAQIAGNFGKRAGESIARGVASGAATTLAEKRGKPSTSEDENADGKAGGEKTPSKSSKDGKHEIKYTMRGQFFICSWPCEFLESRYAGELEAEPAWRARLNALKKKTPEEALDGAVELEVLLRQKRDQAFKGFTDEEIENALAEKKLQSGGIKPIDVSRPPENRLDIEGPIDPKTGKPIPGQVISRDVARQARKLLGQKVSDFDPVKLAWDSAAAGVVKVHGQPTAGNYADLYKNTVEPFWRNVYDDSAAKAYFEQYGYKFLVRGNAPLLEAAIGSSVNADEYRISLDHMAPKATGNNWQRVLDATNLQFVTHADNTMLQNLEKRHPELKRD